jgi:hypothetical protein
MYAYGLDGPIEMRDKLAAELRKNLGQSARLDTTACGGADGTRPEGSKYTVMSFSLADCEVTWCFGPGISTIFVKNNESPHDLCVLSRMFSA